MTIVTTNNIKEIAEQLDSGFRAFIHKTTAQFLFVPDENSLSGIDIDTWDEELEKLDNNPNDYFEIDKWTSSEAFELMSEYAEQLGDHNLQKLLFDAIRKKKPFREFKFIIDSLDDYKQQWFDFKNKWQQAYVERQLNQLELTIE